MFSLVFCLDHSEAHVGTIQPEGQAAISTLLGHRFSARTESGLDVGTWVIDMRHSVQPIEVSSHGDEL